MRTVSEVLENSIHKSVEEFSIKMIDIAGFSAATKALRLPFGEKNKPTDEDSILPCCLPDGHSFLLYEADVNLMSALVKRGDEHAKVLRGVVVWAEINAPRYWWQECDRYSVGATCLSSNSTMHQQGKGLSEDELVSMKENLPEGTMQKRVWMFSYQTLRRMYFQRRDHRLPQWRMFCGWIETLPYAKYFITVE